jgi:signal-transduction protein with cAMP-binding, CBS, and nucleotidyltransferase domain
MEDPRNSRERTEPLDVEAALLSRETAESLEKIFNVLMKLNLAGDLNSVDGGEGR